MALNIQNIKRVFKFGNRDLADPNPDFTPDEVMAFYSNTYPSSPQATSTDREWSATTLSMSSRQR